MMDVARTLWSLVSTERPRTLCLCAIGDACLVCELDLCHTVFVYDHVWGPSGQTRQTMWTARAGVDVLLVLVVLVLLVLLVLRPPSRPKRTGASSVHTSSRPVSSRPARFD